jgi:hypothetical protein
MIRQGRLEANLVDDQQTSDQHTHRPTCKTKDRQHETAAEVEGPWRHRQQHGTVIATATCVTALHVCLPTDLFSASHPILLSLQHLQVREHVFTEEVRLNAGDVSTISLCATLDACCIAVHKCLLLTNNHREVLAVHRNHKRWHHRRQQ